MALGRKTGGRIKGQNKLDDLEAFARRIERQILNSNLRDCENIERLFCRLMTNDKSPAVAAMLLSKWVEWRYGKAKETHEHNVKVEMTTDDAKRIIRDYLVRIEASRSIEMGSSNSEGAAQQDRKILSN